MNFKKSKGFSLIEVMLSLAIAGSIGLLSYQIIHSKSQIAQMDNAAEILLFQEKNTLKYLNDNNDSLLKTIKSSSNKSMVVTLSKLNTNSDNIYSTSFFLMAFENPCVILTLDSSGQYIVPYMLYVNKGKNLDLFQTKNLNRLTVIKKNIFNVDSNNSIVKQYKNDINSNCKISNINSNSLLLDYSKSPFFTSKRIITTDQSINDQTTNEALKIKDTNLNNKTMNTNLYLDVVVKESTPYMKYYCDENKAKVDFATQLHQTCVDYATRSNTYLDGIEVVRGYTLNGSTCQYNALANFSGYFTSNYIGGSSPSQVQQNGQSYINSGCQWQSTHGGTTNPAPLCGIPWQLADRINPNRGCAYGNTYQCTTGGVTKEFTLCAEDPTNQTYINQGCVKSAGPWHADSNHLGACSQDELNQGYYQGYYDYVLCKIGGSTSSQQTCGTFSVGAYIDQGITPPQHKFQALSFGDKGNGEIQMRSSAGNGAAVESNISISISRAGVKSGYVMIKSNNYLTDSKCDQSELGKMVQQQNDSSLYTRSQLVCTYDPDFCGGTGYCYSPLKSQSVIVKSGGTSQIACPAGLRVDTDYVGTMTPSATGAGGLLNSPICSSTYNGYSLKSGIYGDRATTKDGSKVTSVTSFCSYQGGLTVPLNNLARIQCVSSALNKTFTGCKGDGGGNVTCQ